MVGDIVLYDIIVKVGYAKGKSRGEIDDEKQGIGCNKNLADVCKRKGLFAAAHPTRKKGAKVGMKMYADLVEAVIGAAELDGQRPAAECAVRALGLFRS